MTLDDTNSGFDAMIKHDSFLMDIAQNPPPYFSQEISGGHLPYYINPNIVGKSSY
ncbi:MAG: hypothetical protein PUP91_13830 [Rhizonema sp. PD37]|nr:hypothetical protein [Rhizonema sp. PD37]